MDVCFYKNTTYSRNMKHVFIRASMGVPHWNGKRQVDHFAHLFPKTELCNYADSVEV